MNFFAVNVGLVVWGVVTLALWLLRRRPPKMLMVLLPVLAWWFAQTWSRGKPLAVALLIGEVFALRTLLRNKGFSQPYVKAGLRIVTVIVGAGLLALMMWMVTPWDLTMVDLLIAGLCLVPLAFVFGWLVVTHLIAPSAVGQYRVCEGMMTYDGSLMTFEGRVYYRLTWSGLNFHRGVKKWRIRCEIGRALWGVWVIRKVQILGSGWELPGQTLELSGEERRSLPDSDPFEQLATPVFVDDEAQGDQQQHEIRFSPLIWWIPLTFCAILTVEAIILAVLAVRKSLLTTQHALIGGGALVLGSVVLSLLPMYLIRRKIKKDTKKKKPR